MEETEIKIAVPGDFPQVDMEALRNVSPDILGWLTGPGTEIDYPFAQGEDNEYYLTHLADGSGNRNGCLFVDCGNSSDFSDDNTIICGPSIDGIISIKSPPIISQRTSCIDLASKCCALICC